RPAVTQNASSTRAAAAARSAWRTMSARRTRRWAARKRNCSEGVGGREVMVVGAARPGSVRERVLDDVHRHPQRGLTLLRRIVIYFLVLETVPEVAVE